MPHEVTTTVYTIRELSEEAQERAIEQHRDFNIFDDFWFEDIIDDYGEEWSFPAQARQQGFEITTHSVRLMNGSHRQKPNIWFSGFGNQGDGLSFEADVDVEKYIKSHKLGRKFAMILAAIRSDWSVYATVDTKNYPHYSHSGMMYATVESDFAPSQYPETNYDFNKACEREEKFERLLDLLQEYIEDDARELADKFYDTLQREYEYLTSDEQIIDSLEANEVEFTADGDRF